MGTLIQLSVKISAEHNFDDLDHSSLENIWTQIEGFANIKINRRFFSQLNENQFLLLVMILFNLVSNLFSILIGTENWKIVSMSKS